MNYRIESKSLEALTVHVKMERIYPQPARPGPAWYPQYSAKVPEVRLTAGNGLAANDDRNLPLYISSGSKDDFKRIAKIMLPNATIVWTSTTNHNHKGDSDEND